MTNTKTIYTTTIDEMLKAKTKVEIQDHIINIFISHLQNDKDYARKRFIDSPEWRKVITDIYFHNFNGYIEAPFSEDVRDEIKDFLDGNGFIIKDRTFPEGLPSIDWSFSSCWHVREANK